MAILLLFNSSDKLRLCDIMEHTKLSEPELKKQLQTLTETKIVIIEVNPAQLKCTRYNIM
jgi:DNA-binding transcriptional regulator GbsR (MarR family)